MSSAIQSMLVGLPEAVARTAPEDLTNPSRAGALLDLLDRYQTPGLQLLCEALEPLSSRDDAWANVFARAALRLAERLRASAPNDAFNWLERAITVSAHCSTAELATSWGLATFRLVRRRQETEPSRLLEHSLALLQQASRWGSVSLTTNALAFAEGTAWALCEVGRHAESLTLITEALELPRDSSERAHEKWALSLQRAAGYAERRRGRLDEAAARYEAVRSAWYERAEQDEGEVSWLIAEQLLVARLRGQPEMMLRHALDFEATLGKSRDAEVKTEAQYVLALRGHALMLLKRFEESEAALARLGSKAAPNARSMAALTRVRIAEERGEHPEARKLAKAALKSLSRHLEDCHDDLEELNTILQRLPA